MLANYGASVAFIALGVWFYTVASAYHRGALDATLTIKLAGEERLIRTPDVLDWLAIGYAVLLLPYYSALPGVTSKARVAIGWLVGQFFDAERPAFRREEQQAFLALLLKFFFVPLMVNWLLGTAAEVSGHWRGLAAPASAGGFLAQFNAHLYLLAFRLLLAIDVFLFAVGYIVELPALRNEIRSVDPTVAGWVVCLACYPPFNGAFSAFFPWQPSDFPRFADPAVHVALNCLILAAMSVYAWASLALGVRASNLTNRGIVASGPYAWVRHPAYAAKNLAWWIGALPALTAGFTQSFGTGVWVLACVAAWSGLYVARALTEERHLLLIPNGYAQYMQTTRYRFFPGLC
ncbi:MAG TPA: isoprenylcysteine carboxylmethyltransferase family protein [Burkholderiales bacterium]|nr:isoprenylcysteine carboxylmethyltransferase family protein [Burkholderiales bacterium]